MTPIKRPRYNLAQLIRKMWVCSPIRIWWEQHEAQEAVDAGGLLNALEKTSAFAWADRAVALHTLGTIKLSPRERKKARRILLTSLQQPKVDRVSHERFWTAVGTAYFGWLALALMVFGLYTPKGISFPFIMSMILSVPVSFPVASFILALQTHNRSIIIRRIAVTALARIGDPTCIAELTYHLRYSLSLRAEVWEALTATLPRVTSRWYGRLSPDVNAALIHLAKSASEDMALAALAAIDQAGSGSSIQAVRRLADRAASEKVRSRAAAIVPTLIARQKQENASVSLLRASSKVDTEDLVRPVYAAEPDVTNLLRASHTAGPEAADAHE